MKVSAILAFTAALAALSCANEPSKDEKLAEALTNRPPRETYEPILPVSGQFPFLAVLAGQGAGPIRIGANVAQVERLMQEKCEIRAEHLCRYAKYGMDFNLVGGITQSITIQRAGRPAGKTATGEDLKFGFFRGMIPPDLRLGMLPEAIQQYMGAPKRVERVAGPNPNGTVERHYYPGLVLEYDWWPETKKLILGGIVIVKDPKAVAAAAASAAAAAASARATAPAASAQRAPAPPPAREAEPR